MHIRPATGRDIPGILALLRQVGQVHHQLRPDIFRPEALKYDEQALLTILTDETRPIFVAAEGDFVAGYCFCKIRDYDDTGVSTPRRELYIDDLCVDENRRGKHIDTSLCDHAVAFAKELGCQFVTLNVWCGNDAAMKFYERAGLAPRHIMMEIKLC